MRSALREHQVRAVDMLRRSLGTGHKRPMVQAPTGFGKTITAAAMVEGALAKGNRVMFVVPAVSLINQTCESFMAEGITDIGVIQADHPWTDYSKPVQVASVQTLQRREISNFPHSDVVFIDEAHKWFRFMENWFQQWNAIPFVGLSATPWTRGLGKHYDDLIIAATTQDLIDQGYLSDFKVYAPSHPDLSAVKTVAGDYHEGELAKVMGESRLVSDVVTNWLEKGRGRPTLCFAVDRAHARKLQEDFLSKGVSAEYIDAYTDVMERERIARLFRQGGVEVVCNVGCLTTGVDWDVRCIVLARPTKSQILFTQMIGRGLRIAEGKDHCLILDHSDTHLRLGFVTDIYHEVLDDGTARVSEKREREEPLPKECPSCGVLKPVKVITCPSCGFKPERQSEIETNQTIGLGEMSRDEKNRQNREKAKAKRNREATSEEKREYYSGLLWYAADRGWRPGWASNQYRERYGVWPNAYRDVKPSPPTPRVKGFITHQMVKYSKSKQRIAA